MEDTFLRLWELETWMYDHGRAAGWRKQYDKSERGWVTYVKRFGSVWYKLSWSDSPFSKTLYISPTRLPRGTSFDGDAHRAVSDAVRDNMEITGLTMAAIEAKIAELVAAHKKLSAPKQKVDLSHASYSPRYDDAGARLYVTEEFKGEAAVEAWKKDIESILRKEIDSSRDWKTSSLVLNIFSNYGVELYGIPRKVQSRWIRAVLDSMAKRNLITKLEYGRNDVRWVAKP